MQVPGLTPPDLKSYKTDNKGAAIEVRLNAENPSTGFSPSSGARTSKPALMQSLCRYRTVSCHRPQPVSG